MPSQPSPGDPAPDDGALPAGSLAGLGTRPFGVYLHVPFCRVRCGYCDFNTYAPGDLGSGAGNDPGAWAGNALAELDLAARVLGGAAPPAATVFVGGGTPTLLPVADLARAIRGVRDRFGLEADVEVTTEANPDTITPAVAQDLAEAGFTRVSLGMQSSVPGVLRVLDRTHDPAGVARAVTALRGAGLAVSLDLIYGTPGESLGDWRCSLQDALALEPDHVSAYALVVEDGTGLARRVARGEVPMPDDDDEADKYELADEVLSAAGFDWYEVSNWARTPADRCRHNLGYWGDGDWWGVGPGAHGHVGGVRWWNHRLPARWARALADGRSPAQAREVLTPQQRADERVLLGIRLADGLPIDDVPPAGRPAVAALVADGLVDGRVVLTRRRLVLTRRGRLLTDTAVRALLAGGAHGG